MQEYVIIGQIRRPHGVRGKLRVEPLTDEPERFKLLQRVYIRFHNSNQRASFEIADVQIANNYILLSLDGINSRNDAEKFRQAFIEIPREECLPLPEGSFYYFELLNLDVFTDSGKRIGTVADIISYPANDVFVVRDEEDHEFLIPDVADIIDKIDIDQKRIIIKPIDGLLDINRTG